MGTTRTLLRGVVFVAVGLLCWNAPTPAQAAGGNAQVVPVPGQVPPLPPQLPQRIPAFPGAGASGIPPERMRAVYEEVKTPYKYGFVIPAPEGKKVDCPTVFRHRDRWYMVYVQLENDPAGYTTRLATSDDLLHRQSSGTILARGDGDAWDKANAAVDHFYCAVGHQGRAIALATSRPMKEPER